MSAESSKAVVQRFIDEIANGRDLDAMNGLLHEDFRLPPGLDRDGLRAVLQYYFAAFPDLHYAVQTLVAEGDTVVAHVRMSGTHSGEYEGRTGTGQTFAVDEVDIFDVVDDRITGYPFQHIGILSLEFHVDKLSRPLL